MRNIEIKAKVRDLSNLLKQAKLLSNSEGEVIPQHDTFYKVYEGRLKLRKFKNGNGELIFYNRPDTEGPKLSSYEKCSVDSDCASDLNNVLTQALGVNGIVQKTRRLFLVDQTRVHVDNVDGLGDFMELEVVLNDDQSIEEGEIIANSLMDKLGVHKDDLLSGAYRDLMSK